MSAVLGFIVFSFSSLFSLKFKFISVNLHALKTVGGFKKIQWYKNLNFEGYFQGLRQQLMFLITLWNC